MSSQPLNSRTLKTLNVPRLLELAGAIVAASPNDLISLQQAADMRRVRYQAMWEAAIVNESIPYVRMADGRIYVRLGDVEAMPEADCRAHCWRRTCDQCQRVYSSKTYPNGCPSCAASRP